MDQAAAAKIHVCVRLLDGKHESEAVKNPPKPWNAVISFLKSTYGEGVLRDADGDVVLGPDDIQAGSYTYTVTSYDTWFQRLYEQNERLYELIEDRCSSVSASKITIEKLLFLREQIGINGPHMLGFKGAPFAILQEALEAAYKRGNPAIAWDPSRTDEQQKPDYRARLEELVHFEEFEWHHADGSKDRSEGQVLIEKKFPNVGFKVRGKNDMLHHRIGMDPRYGTWLAIEIKPWLWQQVVMGKEELDAIVRQMETEFYLFADSSRFPFMQVMTDLHVVICITCEGPKLYYTVGSWDEFYKCLSKCFLPVQKQLQLEDGGGEDDGGVGDGEGGDGGGAGDGEGGDDVMPPPMGKFQPGGVWDRPSRPKRMKGMDGNPVHMDELMQERINMWTLASEILEAGKEGLEEDDRLNDLEKFPELCPTLVK